MLILIDLVIIWQNIQIEMHGLCKDVIIVDDEV